MRMFACFRSVPHRPPPRILRVFDKQVPGHLYLIKEREFIKTNENIYKIGKTTNIKNRMPSYPKDSRVYLIYYCATNIHEVEKALIEAFDKQFKKRTDIGAEYYETDQDIVYSFFCVMFNFSV
jgi:hypothetical protein